MTILITGAFGFVGTNLSAFLAERGYRLIALDVAPRPLPAYAACHTWENLDAIDWRGIDAVIHLAGKAHDTRDTADAQGYFDVNLGLTQRIFSRFHDSPARCFVQFSSVKAAADRVPAGTELTEEVVPAPRTAYGRSKLAAEQYLQSTALSGDRRLYILRPCMIHGPGNKGNLALLQQVVARGWPWPLGAFDNRRSFTSIENLCHAVEGLMRLLPSGGIYQMADDEPISTRTLVALIAESAGRAPRIWNVPRPVVRAAARAGDLLRLPLTTERLGKLAETYVVSNRKLRQALGLTQFPVAAEEGVRRALAHQQGGANVNLQLNLDQFIRTHVTRREESLLAADLRQFNGELTAGLAARNLLVIGGAGSIGSAFIKAALRFPVAKLCVVDINENGLTELVRDLRSTPGLRVPDSLLTYPVNFDDRVFGKIFRAHGPFQVVANFAAHKHVRSEKDIFSIEAMIENNVLRARRLLELLLTHPPERFFCVSTDKAANPVNVMGASKKLMEELLLAYAARLPVATARFANVAFSNGSLPQGFLDRLSKRQPWSCPRDIRRYFVSPQEAGELCLLAAMLAAPGEIVYPKLDPARDLVPFDRIALALLAAHGLDADVCATEEEARQKAASLGPDPRRWPVYFFASDTSGEKPDEEFVADGEIVDEGRFAALGVILNARRRELAEMDAILARLRACLDDERAEKADLVAVMQEYLPNFAHREKGKTLDQRM